MSEPQSAPAPTNPPVPPPPAAAAPPVAVAPEQNPPWLPERLTRAEEQGKAKALEELGIKDPEKAKKLLADAAKAEEDAKSQGQKLGETAKTLEQERAERERLAKVVGEHAARQISTLTTDQAAAVRAIAPDADPAAQLRAIDALKPTWVTMPPAAVVAPPPAQPTPPAAGTAPPPNAPPPAGTVSPPDRKAEYLALKAKNPHAAAVFLNKHADAIYPPSQ